MFIREIAIVVLTTLVAGCATMSSVDQQIAINSKPEDADVKIGEMSGVTPMTVTVQSGYSLPKQFTISKDGYQPQTVPIQRGFRTSALIQDIFPGIFLGFIPLIVDAITGDWWYVANSSYNVRMQPMSAATPPSTAAGMASSQAQLR